MPEIKTRYGDIYVKVGDTAGHSVTTIKYRPTVLLGQEETKRCIAYNKHLILRHLTGKGIQINDINVDKFALKVVSGLPSTSNSTLKREYVLEATLEHRNEP